MNFFVYYANKQALSKRKNKKNRKFDVSHPLVCLFFFLFLFFNLEIVRPTSQNLGCVTKHYIPPFQKEYNRDHVLTSVKLTGN